MSERDGGTEGIRLVYDRPAERGRERGRAEDLRWLCSQAEGETLEIGIGRGRTLGHYPRGVELRGIDASASALAAAQRRASELGLAVQLQEASAAALPYPDESLDTVAFCFSLHSLPDGPAAIAEAARVLRCGGRLLLVEQVRSSRLVVRATQRIVGPAGLRRAGDRQTRDPVETVLAEEFKVEYLERRLFGTVVRLVARKPEPDELEEAV